MPVDFSDSEVHDFAMRVITLLDMQREYFVSRDRVLLGECRFQEQELRKLADAIVHVIRDGRRKATTQYTQPVLFDNTPMTLPG